MDNSSYPLVRAVPCSPAEADPHGRCPGAVWVKVASCPFCQGTHYHGPPSADPRWPHAERLALSLRCAHCTSEPRRGGVQFDTAIVRIYILVEERPLRKRGRRS